MATMEELINKVFVELRYASGRDVQIHLQEFVGNKINQLYRTLTKKFTFRDFIDVNEFTTDANGHVPNISNTITKFADIVAVFNDREIKPLPVAEVMKNTRTIRRPTLVAVGGAPIFAIYPQKEYDITLISKRIHHEDYKFDDEVDFYPDLLVLGAASELASASGVNEERTQRLTRQFDNLLETYINEEMQHRYALANSVGGIPEHWHVNE